MIARLFLFLTLLGSVGVSLAQSGGVDEDKYTLNPTFTGSDLYVPTNLQEAVDELSKMLQPALATEIRESSSDGLIIYHFSLGRWMRNNWGLWGNSELAQYFQRRSICHPDAMSSVILTAYWQTVNNLDITFDEHVPSQSACFNSEDSGID